MKVDTIVIHCADTPVGMDIGVDEIRKWHINERGWSDIGYHYVIRTTGRIELGRDLDGDGLVLDNKGAHVFGHNSHSIGICLVGGKGSKRTDHFLTNFKIYQSITCARLINSLQVVYNKNLNIVGHHDLDPQKECPGFQVAPWWEEHKIPLNLGVNKVVG